MDGVLISSLDRRSAAGSDGAMHGVPNAEALTFLHGIRAVDNMRMLKGGTTARWQKGCARSMTWSQSRIRAI